MAKASVLMLCNKPLLPKDHPDAESEHTVVAIAEKLMSVLRDADYHVRFLQLGADPAALWRELHKRRPNVVFNLYEGQLDNPETESFVAGLLDWAGVPYTGSPFAALSLARAKDTAKHLLRGAGLPTADFRIVECLPMPACDLKFPVIVKPARQDASVGVDQESVCVKLRQLQERVRYILATYGPPVLVEEYIDGREFNVALVELPKLQALSPAEIVFPKTRPGDWSIFTYGAKWQVGTEEYEQTRSQFPRDLPAALVRKLHQLAMKAYRLLGCRDYARVDFRMKPSGQAYLLEVNPNPDISLEADLTRCLGSVGLSHAEFIVQLVEQALSRKNGTKPTFAPVSRAPSGAG